MKKACSIRSVRGVVNIALLDYIAFRRTRAKRRKGRWNREICDTAVIDERCVERAFLRHSLAFCARGFGIDSPICRQLAAWILERLVRPVVGSEFELERTDDGHVRALAPAAARPDHHRRRRS
jgi:hypothetical protein